MAEHMGGNRTPALQYLSVCSGIEAATVAWEPLGFRPLAFSEIEPFPCAVLAHHYPDVPLHGDFTRFRDEDWIVDADTREFRGRRSRPGSVLTARATRRSATPWR